MNRKQIGFQIGRAFYKLQDVYFLAFTSYFGVNAIQDFSKIHDISDFENIIPAAYNTILAIFSGKMTLDPCVCRYYLHKESKDINKNKEKYLLEHVDSIIIDDVNGLEYLLEKTRKSGFSEWGTYLNAHEDNNRAVIHRVLDPEDAKRMGLVGKGTLMILKTDKVKAEQEGFNGFHHCHPKGTGATNFTVGFNDHALPINWINLLSFNLSGEPEIIGYNRQFTYIPKDKTKKLLVKANPHQIMEYLKS